MKGILFKPDMIKAIVEGRKTVTRRVIKPQPTNRYHSPIQASIYLIQLTGTDAWGFQRPSCADLPFLVKPRYQVGETVYIKEAYCRSCYDDGLKTDSGGICICYRADMGPQWKGANPCVEGKWSSPMMMPAWAARHFIKILKNSAELLKLPLPAEELRLEGGNAALPMLEKRNRLWVFRHEFEYQEER